MTVSSKDLLNDLQARGLIAQMTAEDELKNILMAKVVLFIVVLIQRQTVCIWGILCHSWY